MIFTNVWELLKDMKSSGSTNILCADNIAGIAGYGWVCQDTGKVWAIRLVDVIKTGNLSDSLANKGLLRQYFSSPENRQKIVELLDTLWFKEEQDANL